MPEFKPKYRIDAVKARQVDNAFTYHPPKDDQAERYQHLREAFRLLARDICGYTPASREQSLALTHLEEACMFANAAIARNE